MGALYSKCSEDTKKFFSEKTRGEVAYLVLAAPLIAAQFVYVQMNYKKLPELVPSNFKLDGTVAKKLGKWSLFLLPAASLLVLISNLSPQLKAACSKLNFLKPQCPNVGAATAGFVTALLAYITCSQVRIAQGHQNKLSPAITYSLLAATLGLPIGEKIYHAVKGEKTEVKVEKKETTTTEADGTKKTETTVTKTAETAESKTVEKEETKTVEDENTKKVETVETKTEEHGDSKKVETVETKVEDDGHTQTTEKVETTTVESTEHSTQPEHGEHH